MVDAAQLQMLLLLFTQFGEKALQTELWNFMKIHAPNLLIQAHQRMVEMKTIQTVLGLLSGKDNEFRHKKVQAVKLIKDQFGLGLKEAKEVCDAWVVYLYENMEAVENIRLQYVDGNPPELNYRQKDIFELLKELDELNDLKKATL